MFAQSPYQRHSFTSPPALSLHLWITHCLPDGLGVQSLAEYLLHPFVNSAYSQQVPQTASTLKIWIIKLRNLWGARQQLSLRINPLALSQVGSAHGWGLDVHWFLQDTSIIRKSEVRVAVTFMTSTKLTGKPRVSFLEYASSKTARDVPLILVQTGSRSCRPNFCWQGFGFVLHSMRNASPPLPRFLRQNLEWSLRSQRRIGHY